MLVSPSSLWSFAIADPGEAAVLVELGVVEQRYAAVLEVNRPGIDDVALL